MRDEDTGICLDARESDINIGPIQEPIKLPKVKSRFGFDKNFSTSFSSEAPTPNTFHRLMQRWLLGIHWREVEDDQ